MTYDEFVKYLVRCSLIKDLQNLVKENEKFISDSDCSEFDSFKSLTSSYAIEYLNRFILELKRNDQ